MVQSPLTFAFFASSESEQSHLLIDALSSQGHTVKLLDSIDALRYFEDVEFCTFEVILFGPQFADSIDAQIALMRQLRTQPDLVDMPMVIMSGNERARFHGTLYDAGADMVTLPTTSPTDLVHAFRSLLAKQSERRRLLESAKFTLDSEMLTLSTLSICPQPIIVLNPNLEVRWLNPQAESVLGLGKGNSQTHSQYLAYLSGAFRNTDVFSNENVDKLYPLALETLDGVTDWWDVQVQSFFSPEGNIRGHVVLLSPQIKRRLTAKRISQITQLESMALLTAACAHSVMEKTESGIAVGPYRQIERFLGSSSQEVNINSVVTSLLEYLDPVIDPELTIKVLIPHEAPVSMPFGDCFQLIGHMLFTAIGFVCGKGEISISCEQHEPGVGTFFNLKAQSITRSRMLSVLDADAVDQELQYSNPEHSEQGLQLASRFQKIRELTGLYRTELQFQTKGEELLKLRVALPSRHEASLD